MTTTKVATATSVTDAELRSYWEAFARRLDAGGDAFLAALDRYVDALRAAVESGARDRPATGEVGVDEVRAFGDAIDARLADPAMAETDTARAGLIDGLEDRFWPPDERLPETIERTVAGPRPASAPAPAAVRTRWPARAIRRVRRLVVRADRYTLPVDALARFYAGAELPRRLLEPLNEACRLRAVTLGSVAARFETVFDAFWLERTPSVTERGRGLEAELAEVSDRTLTELSSAADRLSQAVHRLIEQVATEFETAVLAGAVRVDDARTGGLRARIHEERRTMVEGWREYERALEAALRTRITAAHGIARMVACASEYAAATEAVMEEKLRLPLRSLARALADEARALPDVLDREDTLHDLRKRVDALFEVHGKPSVAGLVPALEATTDRLVAAFAAVPETVPETAPLADFGLDTVPAAVPSFAVRDVPLRRIFAAPCTGGLARRAERRVSEDAEELRRLGAEIRRLWQAITFNITVAARIAAAEPDAEQPAERIRGVLERSAAQIEELLAHGLAVLDPLGPTAQRDTVEQAREIHEFLVKREFMRMRSDIAGERATRQLRLGLVRLARAAGIFTAATRRSWERSHAVAAGLGRRVGRHLGLARVERERLFEYLDRSRLDSAFHPALPALYRELFAADAIDPEWTELLVSREAELEVIDRAWRRWQRGSDATLAVIGEVGSGKTTLVRVALRRLAGDEVPVRAFAPGHAIAEPQVLEERLAALFDRPGTADLDELAGSVHAGPASIVVFEDAHHLFLRTVGGFAGLDAFLGFVARTRDRLFWILTMDEYAWRYLERVVGISQYFPYEVNTSRLSAEKLEDAVMARHGVSGYALRIETDGRRTERRAGILARLLARAPTWSGRRRKGEMTRRESARSEFFRRLAEIAEGNVFLGFFYWLRSIAQIEGHTITMRMPEELDVANLEQLPLNALHTVAAVIVHGGLSVDAYARVVNTSVAQSRLHLTALADANLLFEVDGEYRINKVLYRPFVRLLRQKNIL